MYERRVARFIRRGIGIRKTRITVYRAVLNEFSEACGEELVTEIYGQYYRGSRWRLAIDIANKGALKPKHDEGFLTTYDDRSLLISDGDCFVLEGKKFVITDIYAEKGIYVDLSIMNAGVVCETKNEE